MAYAGATASIFPKWGFGSNLDWKTTASLHVGTRASARKRLIAPDVSCDTETARRVLTTRVRLILCGLNPGYPPLRALACV